MAAVLSKMPCIVANDKAKNYMAFNVTLASLVQSSTLKEEYGETTIGNEGTHTCIIIFGIGSKV